MQPEQKMLRRLSELVSIQNAQIDNCINRIVENATIETTLVDGAENSEIRKTTDLLVMNSLIQGEFRS